MSIEQPSLSWKCRCATMTMTMTMTITMTMTNWPWPWPWVHYQDQETLDHNHNNCRTNLESCFFAHTRNARHNHNHHSTNLESATVPQKALCNHHHAMQNLNLWSFWQSSTFSLFNDGNPLSQQRLRREDWGQNMKCLSSTFWRNRVSVQSINGMSQLESGL